MNLLGHPEFKFALREDLQNDKKFLPVKGEPYATGYDVRAALNDPENPLIIKPGEYFKIPLGFRTIPEEGWWFQLHPRSSSFAKKYMHNLIGIIDEHFSLETIFAGQYLPQINASPKIFYDTDAQAFDEHHEPYKAKIFNDADLIIKHGDAIGQIIPIKRIEMVIKEINNKEYDDLCKRRMAIRTGGFGSTG